MFTRNFNINWSKRYFNKNKCSLFTTSAHICWKAFSPIIMSRFCFYFNQLSLSCTAVVLACFEMCGFCNVWVF